MSDSRSGSVPKTGDVRTDTAQEQRLQAWKMRFASRLAGGVGHDLRNQLTVIRGYCDLVTAQLPGESDLRDSVDHIRSACDRATAITGQLLSVGGRQALSPEVFDLNEAVPEICESLRRMVGEDIRLTFIPDARGCPVKADQAVLAQVLANLAVNAREAMPGGGELTIRTAAAGPADASLPIEGLCPKDCVTLAVTDTGAGMDERTLAQAFEPFFSTKQEGRGAGLGLSMVWSYAADAGGYVDAVSRPGLGSTFTLYLPRAQVPTPQAADPGGETVLVVEDEQEVRSLIIRMLGREGYHVLTAPGGREGLEVARRHDGPIHLLVTDVVMPSLSGPELARRLKADRPEMEVLFVTGHAEDVADAHQLADLGAGVLAKPFDTAALARAVHGILDPGR